METRLLMAAGGLVMICQLVAMAMVADHDVQTAGVRDLQRVAQQAALAACLEQTTGPHRHNCMRQAQWEPGTYAWAAAHTPREREPGIRNVAAAGEAAVNETAGILRVSVQPTR